VCVCVKERERETNIKFISVGRTGFLLFSPSSRLRLSRPDVDVVRTCTDVVADACRRRRLDASQSSASQV